LLIGQWASGVRVISKCITIAIRTRLKIRGSSKLFRLESIHKDIRRRKGNLTRSAKKEYEKCKKARSRAFLLGRSSGLFLLGLGIAVLDERNGQNGKEDEEGAVGEERALSQPVHKEAVDTPCV